jgi:hypothetical protein
MLAELVHDATQGAVTLTPGADLDDEGGGLDPGPY